jgi:hypothetical protein
MDPELIRQANSYLNGDLSYNVGVSVFIKISRNENLNRQFLLPHSPEREKNLKNELYKITKLYENNEKTSGPKYDHQTGQRLRLIDEPQELYAIEKTNTRSTSSGNISNGSVLSGLTDRLQNQRKELYRLRGHLHGQLHIANTDEERHQLAFRIMNSQGEIDDLNRDIKSIESGNVPSKHLKVNRSADEYIRIRNLKTYIARYEKKIENCTSLKGKQKFEAILNNHKEELKLLT